MKTKMLRRLVFALGFGIFTGLASGQVPGAGADSALIRLFEVPAFTGKATIRVLDAKGTETLRMPSTFALLDGKLRVDVDWAQIISKALKPSDVASIKQAGLDRLSSVIRPDKKTTYIIYPALQSYASMPLSDQDVNISSAKVSRTALGHETIDGHACVKNRSVVRNQQGQTVLDAVTWNAADLQNFPVQIETKENGNTSVTRFQQVSLARPDARLFDVAAGYKQYKSLAELQTAAVNRASGKKK